MNGLSPAAVVLANPERRAENLSPDPATWFPWRMAVSDSYREFVIEQLGNVTDVTSRRMFGGIGIYADEAFFALIDNDTLFFKVNDASRPDFEARASKPFQPFGPGTKPMMGYFELPADVLESRELLGAWVHRAIAVARAAGSKPKKSAAKKPKPAAKAKERTGRPLKRSPKH